jgi:arylsulfatase
MRFSAYAGMDIGCDNGGVVDLSYADRKPFAFTGTIKKVAFNVKPHRRARDEQAIHTVAHHAHAAHGLSS